MSAHMQSLKHGSGFKHASVNALTRVVAEQIPSHHVPSSN